MGGSSDNKNEPDNSIQFGKILANPPPGEEVAITGISGKFPESENVHQYRDNLFNKVDMVTDDGRRWPNIHPEIPQRTGKIPIVKEFDAGFFGIHKRQADAMDPMVRGFLEVAIEAIFDAGLHPDDLQNTNTGVFVGACYSESEKKNFFELLTPDRCAPTGVMRSMLANRTSYYLKLKGPSYVCDTACSSSLYALEHAYKAIREGECDRAIVGGTNLCLHPFVSLQFARLGVLSKEGRCRTFDEEGEGYTRSEAICAVLLQKSKDAKRIYSTIIHAKTNCDGFKKEGITYPSGAMQIRLLKEFYQECNVKPNEMSFLEAHGTGTPVGDPEEGKAIAEVFATGRKKRLLIGSIKSNIGHSEPASGLCSIAKAIIAYETGYIGPNLHFKSPRRGMTAIEDGRLKVVVEKMPFEDNNGLIGINSFGFGGGNCHVLLRWNPKEKVNGGIPKDDIPRLVCVSGRTEEAVNALLEDISDKKLDAEQIRLLHNIFRKNIGGHTFRGYTIVSKSGELQSSVKEFSGGKRHLYFAIGEINNDLLNMGKEFMGIPLFEDSIRRIQDILSKKEINLCDMLLTSSTKTSLDKVLCSVAIQISLVDTLKKLDVKPNGIIGHSLGEFVSAYFDGALTLKELIECAYTIGGMVNNIKIDGTVNFNEKLLVSGDLWQKLSKILSKPKEFTKMYPANSGKMATPEYFLSALTQKTTNGLSKQLSANAVILEIGKMLPITGKYCFISLFKSDNKSVSEFLGTIGRLYELGFNPQIDRLYPKVEFPVSRGTPMISPLIKWNRQTFFTTEYLKLEQHIKAEVVNFSIVASDPDWSYVTGHLIDGRNLFPATGYLDIAWQTLAFIKNTMKTNMNVVFENIKFIRACTFPKDALNLIISIERGSGKFEISEGGVVVVTGIIHSTPLGKNNVVNLPEPNASDESEEKWLESKDIYKELRLRGYNYRNMFRSIKECNAEATVAKIKWENNWVAFMDNMLQMKILQEDTRLLYVPTSIARLSIDAPSHMKVLDGLEENKEFLFPAYVMQECGIIKSGAIEIRGLVASSIPRRKNVSLPVLEKYQFIPNVTKLQLHESIRVNLEIALENTWSIKVKIVELIDEATQSETTPLSFIIQDVLGDQPLIQANITILSKNPIEVDGIEVSKAALQSESENTLVVGSKLLERPGVYEQAYTALKQDGYVLSREQLDFQFDSGFLEKMDILSVHIVGQEKFVFLRKSTELKKPITVNVSTKNKQFNWLNDLKTAVKINPSVIVYAQDEPLNGIIGLVNCIRREPSCEHVKCVFIVDKAPPFDINNEFYSKQLKKNMAVNVYKNGLWGTYRHLLIDGANEIESEHCYVNSTVRGDLSSLKWIEGPLTQNTKLEEEQSLVNVYYSSLNFRDVMTASGRINVDVITRNRREQECVQGFEFSGRRNDGKRVMGMVAQGSLATLVKADDYLLWDVPQEWSLEDAATVPVVYSTCIYALMIVGNIQPSDVVLIHSGTGGIGQAAINMCLNLGCTIFTTVGTNEKKEFIKKHFPKITDRQIGNSRDLSFHQQIMKETKGRGVDIVLNSLAEEKLLASIDCLAQNGRFLEIGKFDIANNNAVHLMLLKNSASFHGVMLDKLFNEIPFVKKQIKDLLFKAIKDGAVKPLKKNIFKANEVEQAFRFMATGKHMGKVLIQIREEEKEKLAKPEAKMFKGISRYFCNDKNTYIVCGGLGGFGLELADWLILRGARKIVLTSRKGVQTGYQNYRIKVWKSYGCTIKISTADITNREGCEKLIREANALGPVEAIFNLAVVLEDAILENQSEKSFETSFGPKAYATEYLDEVTRRLCFELKDFVIFSSVSCGRGNAGQTNYGMSNSVMERICEKRRDEGFPALAIEWGAIGDVGLVAEMQEEHVELEIGGTLQQSISNCLQVMDVLMRQKDASIVSSIVVAEKKITGSLSNAADAIATILGLRDIKSVSVHSTFAELGMDSMTAVEIKQTLEREFDMFLTAEEIRNLTFARIHEIQEEKISDDGSLLKVDTQKKETSLQMILRYLGDEDTFNLATVHLDSNATKDKASPQILMFPGIEGVAVELRPLAANLNSEVISLQYCNSNQKDTIPEMAEALKPCIEETLEKSQPFHLVAHSFGVLIALEVARILEKKGYAGQITCVDGSPLLMKKMMLDMFDLETEEAFQTRLICAIFSRLTTEAEVAKYAEALFICKNMDERLQLVNEKIKQTKYSTEYVRDCILSTYKRLKAIINYEPKFKLNSPVYLCKPTIPSIKMPMEDYGLSELCTGPVDIKYFEGNHVSILENKDLAAAINEMVAIKSIFKEE